MITPTSTIVAVAGPGTCQLRKDSTHSWARIQRETFTSHFHSTKTWLPLLISEEIRLEKGTLFFVWIFNSDGLISIPIPICVLLHLLPSSPGICSSCNFFYDSAYCLLFPPLSLSLSLDLSSRRVLPFCTCCWLLIPSDLYLFLPETRVSWSGWGAPSLRVFLGVLDVMRFLTFLGFVSSTMLVIF